MWQQDAVYVMDNHRAALWCWLQKMEENKKYNLFHIDQHSDALIIRDEVRQAFPDDLRQLSLTDYLRRTCTYAGSCMVPAISADNFLSFFLERYPKNINRLLMATHGKGDHPDWHKQHSVPLHELPGNFVGLIQNSDWGDGCRYEWIVDVDLDYFFYADEKTGEHYRLLADEYVEHLFSQIARAREGGLIRVLTIALSPPWCGGWGNAETLCTQACAVLGIPFELPSGDA